MNHELAKTLTTALVQFIDKERPEGTICCSSYECEKIEKAFEGGRRNGFTAGYNKAMKEVEQKEQKPVVTLGETYHVDTLGTQQVIAGKMPQKPAEWDDYTKTNLGRAIQIIKDARGTLHGYQTDDGIYECDKAIEALEHFLYRGLEIEKSAEWSEEDEGMLNCIIATLCEEEYGGRETNDKMVTWLDNRLKSLRPQPKQEWSEEDEIYLQDALWCVEKAEKSCKDEEDKGACWSAKRWLKSLRPSWKPSEEQMEALEYVIRDYREDSCNATANYLQEILDHLKNM